jgi:quinol monooxygenase YgiN
MIREQVTVTARIKVKSGMEQKFQEEYLPIVNLTVAEEGCLSYKLHQSQTDSSVFLLYEQWMSKADLDLHLQMPYIKAINQKASDFLAEPVEMNLWAEIS